MGIFDFINKPLGYLLNATYNFVGSYGLAIIIFTIIIRVILIPLSIKQQQTMAGTSRLQPKIKELEKKYKNDKQKQSEEMMKLYKEEGVNPASGCLPLLIQLPIIIGLYTVITRPLTYLLGLTQDQITVIANALNLGIAEKQLNIQQIAIAQAMKTNFASLPAEFANLKVIDFNFLGLNLGANPSISHLSVLWIIPLLATVTAYLSSYVTTKINPSQQGNSQAAAMNKSMLYTMPLMSLWFTFTMPAGVGLYWIMSNVLMIFQQYVLNVFIPVNKDAGKKEKKKDA